MFKVTHTFFCKVCGTELPISYQFELAQNPIPVLPTGWIQFSDGYVCDKHKVSIDQEVEETK